MSADIRLSEPQVAVLNLLARCSVRLGKTTLQRTDFSVPIDLWYNYADQRDHLSESSLTEYLESLIEFGFVEFSPDGYRLTEEGKTMNTLLTQKAEALATRLWETSELCKKFRQDLYGLQMRILSQKETPDDVPLFNLLSDDHAEAIDSRLKKFILAHETIDVLDYGRGVISRVPELLMQRPDFAKASYCFVDNNPETILRLQFKHKDRNEVSFGLCLHDEVLPEGLKPFDLAFAMDVLYFVPDSGDARAATVQSLFNQLAMGGLLIFSLGSAPKLSFEEIMESKDGLLPIEHPRSGLAKVMALFLGNPQARVEVLAEPYENSWNRFAGAFARVPTSTDPGLERLRFETAQVIQKIHTQQGMPAGRWTVFVEKISL
jgi:hypothetical protein